MLSTKKSFYQLYLLPPEFCNLNLIKISAGLFWLTCVVHSALQIQLWVPSHGNKTCTKSLFTHICHIRERIKLIACAILQAFESMSFRLKVMSLIILPYPLQTQLHLLCFFCLWPTLEYEIYPIWIYTTCDKYCIWATWGWWEEEQTACWD